KGGGFLAFLRKSIAWRIKNVTRRARTMPSELSLDAPVGDTGATIADFIGDDSGADDEFDYDSARTQLDQMMRDRLTDREHQVIMRRHLLNGSTTVPTLEELGAEMGLSRETIRKDEIAAEQKIGLRG